MTGLCGGVVEAIQEIEQELRGRKEEGQREGEIEQQGDGGREGGRGREWIEDG